MALRAQRALAEDILGEGVGDDLQPAVGDHQIAPDRPTGVVAPGVGHQLPDLLRDRQGHRGNRQVLQLLRPAARDEAGQVALGELAPVVMVASTVGGKGGHRSVEDGLNAGKILVRGVPLHTTLHAWGRIGGIRRKLAGTVRVGSGGLNVGLSAEW